MPAALFGILLSALQSVLGFVLRSTVVKFVTFFALYFVVTEFVTILINWGLFSVSGKSAALSNALFSIPSSIWYFLDLMNFSFGISSILSAYVTRFIIRRIPVIG